MIRHVHATATHVGQVREINQDRSLVSETISAVADGMGGHVGGEKAAAIAIDELASIQGQLSADRLARAARSANTRVYNEGADPELRGMGTTLVAAVVDEVKERVHVVNVGDSRAYRLRGDKLEQITVDHSLVEDLVREGRLTPEEAATHPQRNIVTRALGIAATVDVDSFEVETEPGDRILLASDGLFNEVDAEGITEILLRQISIDQTAQELVSAAVRNGGRDNVTVALIDVFDAFDLVGERPVPGEDVSLTDDVPLVGVDTEAIDPVSVDPEPEAAPEPIVEPEPLATIPETPAPEDSAPETPAPEDPAPEDPAPEESAKPSKVKRIFGLFVTLAVGAGIYAGASWYATSAWFADDVDGQVAILQGRPDGVLWWDPSVVETSDIDVDTLDPVSAERLAARQSWTTLDDAKEFVSNLDIVEN